MVDTDADATGIGRDVVDAIRDDFTKLLVNEVIHIDLVGTAFRPIVTSAVLVAADWFLLLCVDRNHRLTNRLRGYYRGVDVLKLCVTVRIMAAFQGLAVHLAAIS